jgi:hypothetical protein
MLFAFEYSFVYQNHHFITLIGPTAFGRIPGFTEHIFPDDSKPYLSLVANIGMLFRSISTTV